MTIDEALYQIKQRIKMHELEDTTNIANEREKALLDYITNLQEENQKLKDYLKIMEKGKDNNLYRFLDYKQRIDKAIEYLTDEKREFSEDCYYKICETLEARELLNVLRGDE